MLKLLVKKQSKLNGVLMPVGSVVEAEDSEDIQRRVFEGLLEVVDVNTPVSIQTGEEQKPKKTRGGKKVDQTLFGGDPLETPQTGEEQKPKKTRGGKKGE